MYFNNGNKHNHDFLVGHHCEKILFLQDNLLCKETPKWKHNIELQSRKLSLLDKIS